MTKATRRLAAAAAIALLAATLAVLAVRYLTFLSSLENIAGDIRIGALQEPMPQSKDIVIAAIDEGTLAQFAYRSPVDRGFLANLLKTLEAKGARLIALDVILDQPTEPEKDEALRRTLREVKTPLLVSYAVTPSIVNEEQLAYMNDFVPANLRAAANLASDPFDGTVRWIYPGRTRPDEPLGFVRKAMDLLGHKTPTEQVEIAWRPKPDAETPAFPTYPASTVALLPDEWFKGKVVLVGAILSMTDRHRTPLAVVDAGDDGNMPGIVVQAHGIAQYLEGRSSERLSPAWIAGVTLVFALLGVGISLLQRGILFNVALGGAVVAAYWIGAMLGYSHGVPLLPLVAPTLGFAFSVWMMDVLIGRGERKQREFVQGAFSRYVSPAVVDQLVADPSAVAVKGIRREATFIFTDVAGFTTLSEQLSSEALADCLNAYLDGACAIILRYGGTIDKFIGDAIMAIFNAPIEQPDHAERAVNCALELDAYAEAFRKEQNALGIPIGVTRIGVHCGPATIGNFGSASRMDFTALGDTVNTAARTEGVNKYFGTRICCTQEVVARCPDLSFRPIGDVVLKGKTEAVTLYSPVDAAEAKSELMTRYAAAYALLKAGLDDAGGAVRELHQLYPDDPIVNFHRERVEKGLVTNLVVMEDK